MVFHFDPKAEDRRVAIRPEWLTLAACAFSIALLACQVLSGWGASQ